MIHPANGSRDVGRRRGVMELQKEMLQLDLIDAEGGTQEEEGEDEEEEEEEGRPLLLIDEQREEERSLIATMDTYRPKRPTTLNLFPQVPRTQDTINNNSFGEKDRRKEKKTHSSSPHIKGAQPATCEHVTPTEGGKVQTSSRLESKPAASVRHKAPVSNCKKQNKSSDSVGNNICTVPVSNQAVMKDTTRDRNLTGTVSKEKDHYNSINGCQEHVQYPEENRYTQHQSEKNKDRSKETRADIQLTPVGTEQERPFLSQSSDSNRMSISSDTELPPLHFHSLAERTNPSISEEDEVYPPTPPCRTDSLSEAADCVSNAKTNDKATVNVANSTDASGLTYDSVKYTLVVDEHSKLELVSLKQCYHAYDSDSDNTVYESAVDDDDDEDRDVDDEESGDTGGMNRDTSGLSTDSATDTSDMPRSRKFHNVFMNRRPRYSEVKSDWLDTFWVKFLGSVQVPYHKGNDVLCAAMQKVATNRRTMQFNPPSMCIVEINIKGVKIIVQEECEVSGGGDKYCHFFQLKNISFCGCHPKNKKYFGLITKHPAHQRFACHVFFSEEHAPYLAESVSKAFQQFYKEHMEYSCPTEDIFLE
ncbi:C-Jun-amino-terminal kinase-interacting protein 1 [Bagarius yarrelli]|uniref:C-Jun-amino-terminal kinase-interacting protein 1 n=1 Tax=Bagarius yarrelli TaxID=175774 RepID=A0A556V0M2_BAGYA|nr:C-Jun-amino-terminal kinase-interacting protein 1 [Bagarius yarrelli]